MSITADADGVKRGTKEAERHLNRLGGVGSKALGGLKSGIAGAGLAAAGGLAVGLTASAGAAIEAEKSASKLAAQLETIDKNSAKVRKQIDGVVQSQSKMSGFDDEDLTDSFTNIVRVTGDVNKSLKLNEIAMDIARAKHMDVAKAGELVGKVAGGNTGILGRYGIVIDKGSTATEALGQLQERFAGQADKYGKTTAGSLDRAKVASENLGEIVGAKLTPLLAKAAEGLVGVVEAVQRHWPEIQRIARRVFSAVGDAVTTARQAISRFVARNRDDIDSFISALRNVARWVRNTFEDVVLPIIRRMLPGIRQAFEGATRVIRGAVRLISGILTGDFRKAWSGVKDIFSGAVKAIGGIIRAGTAPIREAASRLGGALKGAFKGALDGVLSIARGLINKIIDVINILPGVNIGHVGGGDTYDPGGSGNPSVGPRGAPGATQRRQTGGKVTAPTVIMGEEAPAHPEWVIATNPAYRNRNVGLWMQAGRDLGVMPFAHGGRRPGTGGFGDTIGNVAGTVAGVVGDAAQFIGRLPGNPFRSPFDGIGGYVLDKTKSWIRGKVNKVTGYSGRLGRQTAAGVDTFNPIASRYGLSLTSGFRPGDDGFHGLNRARDYSDGYATPAELAFARFMAKTYGSSLTELIHTPLGFGIKNGKRVPLSFWGSATNADHFDHVHVAYRQGGRLSLEDIAAVAGRAGFRGVDRIRATALAWRESRGVVDAHGGPNSNGSYDNGLWQINDLWADDPDIKKIGWANRFKAAANALMARVVLRKQGWNAWTTNAGVEGSTDMSAARRAVLATQRMFRPGARRRTRAGTPRPRVGARRAGPTQGKGGTEGWAPRADPWAAAGLGLAGAWLDSADAQLALAGLTPDTGDDLHWLRAMESVIAGPGGLLDSARASGDPGTINDVVGRLDSVRSRIGELTSTDGAWSDEDIADRDYALAALNGDPAGMKAALERKRGILEGQLGVALATADPRDELPIISALESVRSSLDQLNETTQDQTRLLQQQIDLANERAVNAEKRAVSAETFIKTFSKWVVDTSNGEIGGFLGLRLQTAGVPGVMAGRL